MATTKPTHPRSSPPRCKVTKAPRGSVRGGGGVGSFDLRPSSWAAMASRAMAKSARRSLGSKGGTISRVATAASGGGRIALPPAAEHEGAPALPPNGAAVHARPESHEVVGGGEQ